MSTLRVLVLILAHCSLMLSQVPLEAPIRDIQIAPNASTTIYVLPSLGLLRSTDGGATWTQLAVLPKNTQPPALHAFTFAPQSASTMYAGGEPAAGGILWKSMDSGATWQNISQDLPMDEGYRVTHIDAIGTSVYAHIRVSSSQWELWKSPNGGQTWTRLATTPRQVAIHAANPNLMFYPGSSHSIQRSQNEGASFTAVGQVRPHTGTLDGVNAVAAHPTNANLLLATMSGPTGSQNGIFRSLDGGSSWTRVHTGNNITVRFSPVNPNEAWAGDCCGNISVYRSVDSGATWNKVAVESGGTVNVAGGPMIFSLPTSQTLLAGTAKGLYRSQNNGSNWQRVGTYSPWLALSESVVEGTLLSRELTEINPSLTIRGAEDPAYRFDNPTATSQASWAEPSITAPATLRANLSARTLSPGQHETSILVSAPGAGNAPLEVKARLTVTNEVRNSFAYLGEVGSRSVFGGIAINPGGGITIGGSARVEEITPDGQVRHIAGGGQGGDGGPASQARLGSIGDIAYDAQGNLYIVERFEGLIRRVAPNGTISTYAGNASGATPVAGMAPTAARFTSLRHIAIDKDGHLLVFASSRIWRVRNNQLEVVVGGGSQTASGTLAASFSLTSINDIAVGPDGRIFFTSPSRHAIYSLNSDGRVYESIGRANEQGPSGDNGPAPLARLRSPGQLAIDENGVIYFTDDGGLRVRRVRTDGIVETVIGNTMAGTPGQCSVAEWAPIPSPAELLVRGNRLLWVGSLRLRQVLLFQGPPNPPAAPGNGIVHAGSFEQKIGPGVLFSIFGERLAAAETAASGAPWPVWLGNTAVCLDGHPAPVFYMNPSQINAQAPFAVRTGETGYLRVFTAGGVTPPIPVNLLATSPGVFEYDGGRAVAQNFDGSINGPQAPAAVGDVVVVYMSGIGELDNPVPTGVIAPGDPLSRPKTDVSATIGGQNAPMHYLGLSPGFIGLAQANVVIPNLPPGDHDLVFTIGAVSSKPVKISIR